MKFLRRTVWFIAIRLLVICLVLGLAVTVFYYAMNLCNIQVVIKDGLANRAKAIMQIETDSSVLERYFQPACLSSDTALAEASSGKGPYDDYNIRGIDHRAEMSYFWIWPWETSVRVIVREKIPKIDGRAKGTRADELVAQYGNDALYPPEWPDTVYRVSLVRENGQWRIKTLKTESSEP